MAGGTTDDWLDLRCGEDGSVVQGAVILYDYSGAELLDGGTTDDWLDLRCGEDGSAVQGAVRVALRLLFRVFVLYFFVLCCLFTVF